MPTMDEYAASGGYARDSQAQINLGGSGFYSGGSSSGSSSGGLSSPASYNGSYTSTTPVVARPGMSDPVYYGGVAPVPVVVPPKTDLLGSIGLGNSGSMMSVLIFGGIFVLFMSLFKG